MRLDRTRIAIIERAQPEILDLAFLVLRAFFLPVVGYVLVLALPLSILNYALIEWMAVDLIEETPIARYLITMSMLIYIKAPFAGILATAFLGKVTFNETPTLKELCLDVLSRGHRILWTQLILRGVLLGWWLVWLIPREDAISPIEWWLPVLCMGLFFCRCFRPYINEIVLLEKSPIWTKSSKQITVGKRSSRLHGPNSGDLFSRGVLIVPVFLSLGLAVLGMFWFIVATFSNDWSWGPVTVHVVVPAVFWILVVYMTVVRFLNYLDLRIRREGWEVELKMRAEANRMGEKMALGKELSHPIQ